MQNSKKIDGWERIKSKKEKKIGKTFPTGWWWCGFDDSGEQKWFIELNTGFIVSPNSPNYDFWKNKIFLRINNT
ncbi:hypothetical protein OAG24_00490 [bacterium]|nr:hypothetical protein [bacterium]